MPCAPEGLVEFLRPKCAPSCTPAEPCRAEDVCPVFAEEEADEGMREDFHASGLVPEGLYPARPQRFLPLQHAGNAGFAIWGRR